MGISPERASVNSRWQRHREGRRLRTIDAPTLQGSPWPQTATLAGSLTARHDVGPRDERVFFAVQVERLFHAIFNRRKAAVAFGKSEPDARILDRYRAQTFGDDLFERRGEFSKSRQLRVANLLNEARRLTNQQPAISDHR